MDFLFLLVSYCRPHTEVVEKWPTKHKEERERRERANSNSTHGRARLARSGISRNRATTRRRRGGGLSLRSYFCVCVSLLLASPSVAMLFWIYLQLNEGGLSSSYLMRLFPPPKD